MSLFKSKSKNNLSPEQVATQKNKAVAQQWMPVMDINNELLHLKKRFDCRIYKSSAFEYGFIIKEGTTKKN